MAKHLKCTKTELAALKLTSIAFGNTSINIEEPEQIDWNDVFEELKAQAVAAVVVDILPQFEKYIPPDTYNAWVMYSIAVMKTGYKILAAQAELVQLFEENKIPLATLKGACAACYYPNPIYRNLGDIDFLVDKDNFDRSFDLMLKSGYRLAYPIDNVDYHVTLDKDGVMYELHKEPAGITHGKQGDILRELYKNAPSNAERMEIDGCDFYRMPRLQNGLVLLLHIVKHLDGGLGLRQICDWLAFVKTELTDEVYNKEFESILKSTGLDTLARILTKMCCKYLGLVGITWCMDADDDACAEFMRFVLNNGNFGRKDAATNRAGAIIGEVKDGDDHPFIISALVNLQKNGVKQWKAVERFHILKYIAWAYIPCRYIGKLITGKRSIKETKKLAGTISNDRSLKAKLAVFK